MIIGLVFLGSIVGTIIAAVSMFMGNGILVALGLYSAAGATTVIFLALATYLLTRPTEQQRPRLLTFNGSRQMSMN